MSDVDELVAAVRARSEGTPYVLTETPKGFDLRIDPQDVAWQATLYRQQLSRTWIFHVKVEEGSKTLSITDDVRDVSWGGGTGSRGGVPTPLMSVAASGTRGRLPGRRVRTTWSPDGHGGYDKTVEVDDTGARARDLIREPARELGWTEKRGASERIGLYVGVGTLVLLVLTGIVVAAVALARAF